VILGMPIPMAAQSKALAYGLSLAGNAGSNQTGDMNVFCECCVVRFRSSRRADHSSRGFLPNVVCMTMISKPQRREGLRPLGLSSHEKKSS